MSSEKAMWDLSIGICIRILTLFYFFRAVDTKLTLWQSDCELEALNIGTRLADRYNSLDEKVDFDTRIHHDYLVKYMGFSGWIQNGLWKNTKQTAWHNSAPEVYKVWALEFCVRI